MQGESTQYRFAGCLLNPGSRTLLCRDKVVEVQSLVFDLLHYLVRHPQQAISKQTLLEKVWHNQYLTDATIAQAVKKARLAVGDDGQQQAVIKTIHGKGISLIVPVTTEQKTAMPSLEVRRQRWVWLLVTVLMLAMGGWLLMDRNASVRASQLSMAVFPFENATGDPEYAWLEYGLAETTSLLLEQMGGLLVRHPGIGTELSGGSLAERSAILGVGYGLTATITRSAEQFAVTWTLVSSSGEEVGSSFLSADGSVIARLLTEAVLAELKDQPAAPVSDAPILNDPLAAELYARGMQALYQDEREMAMALLSAAQARVPESLTLKASVATASFDHSQNEQSMQQLANLLETFPDQVPERVQLLYAIGEASWYSGNIMQASQLLEQVVSATSTDTLLHAKALNSLSFVRQSQSRYNQAWEYAKQAEVLLRDIHDPYHLSNVLTNLGYLAEDLGRLIEAGQYHQQALEIRNQYSFPSLIAASQYGLARIRRRSGDFELAEQLLEQSLATVTRLELSYDRFDNLEELAEVRMRQRRFADAMQLIDRAQTIAEESGDELGLAWSKQMWIRVALRRGEAEPEAFAQINAAIQLLQELGEVQDTFIAQLERAQLLLMADRDDEVQVQLEALLESSAIDNPVLQLQQRLIMAALLAKQQNAAAALPMYLDIVRSSREIGVLDLEAEAAIDAGHLAIASDDENVARRMLAVARSWSEEYYRTRNLAQSIEMALGQ